MSKIDQATLEKLKAEHGEIIVLCENEIEAAFKRPTRAHYKRWRSEKLSESMQAMALENLALGCLVYPKLEELEAAFARAPALPDIFGGRLTDAFTGEDPSVKK